MPRLALGIEYDGSAFAGWQIQRDRRSVQECVEAAVGQVANEPVDVVCAGRTDAGVHAYEQVAHFDTQAKRDLRSWLLGVNTALPDDVRILWVKEVEADFHARYSAIARFYRYTILNRAMKSALQRRQVTWCFRPLNAEKMHAGAQHLIGDHDFSSFRAQSCQSHSPQRIMHFIRVSREGEWVHIDLSANAFVHHMVRNIAGVLIDIGSGKHPPDWAREVLEARDRALGGVTAPPDGLYLGGVFYPEPFGLPKHPIFDLLPPDARRFTPPVDDGGE
ncbi:tRNA pseudouridine(38-40) synthase TruA [Methylococcus sp. EFPC2]|uniref:tRNA pseudouridine(38-40) synthase TruA n=1 Tax=Methylococcus sp. EFPC2 TaxID=2812648 RepID=UPI001967CD2C|nr:tRNA pseudouridine(38-40) synthase TruA [Methylococcus sp. EFPC2]QSA97606.1 tRNA pseudouridine(38-40) synthase TruA [Methylococcus sp. EFPC2]